MDNSTTQYSRIQHHTIDLTGTTLFTGATFTVPLSDDINTFTIYDLFDGEIGVDVQRNKTYMRVGSNINEISLGGSSTVGMSGGTLTTDLNTSGHNINVSVGDLVIGDLGGVINFNTAANAMRIENAISGPATIDLTPNDIKIEHTSVSGEIRLKNDVTQILISNPNILMTGSSISINNEVIYQKFKQTTGTALTTFLTLPILNGECKTYEATVTALDSTGAFGYARKTYGTFRSNGTITQIGTSTITYTNSDFGGGVTASINAAGVEITGQAATTINWNLILKEI